MATVADLALNETDQIVPTLTLEQAKAKTVTKPNPIPSGIAIQQTNPLSVSKDLSNKSGLKNAAQAFNVHEGESIQAAINQARAGDTVYLYAGTYHESISLKQGVNLRGEDRVNTILDGQAQYENVIVAFGDNRIEDLTITGGAAYSGMPRSAVRVEGNHVLIKGNTIKDNLDYGVFLWSGQDTLIETNLFLNNHLAIQCYNSAATGITIQYNTLANNGIGLNLLNGVTPLVKNNIITGSTFSAIYEFNWSAYARGQSSRGFALVEGNVFFNNAWCRTAYGSSMPPAVENLALGNMTVDPRFRDPSRRDYSLFAGSPAIGKGAFLPAGLANALERISHLGVDYSIMPIIDGQTVIGYEVLYEEGSAEEFYNDGRQVLDTTPPEIVILSPVTLTHQASYALRYTVDGVERVETRTLTEGDNTLTVTASDIFGNLGKALIRVRLDTSPEAAFTWIYNGMGASLWSVGANWLGGAAPGLLDTAIFGPYAVSDCMIDTAVTVAGITIALGYTGTITQQADVSVTNDFSIASGATLDTSGHAVTTAHLFDNRGTVTTSAGNIGIQAGTLHSGTVRNTSAGGSLSLKTTSGALSVTGNLTSAGSMVFDSADSIDQTGGKVGSGSGELTVSAAHGITLGNVDVASLRASNSASGNIGIRNVGDLMIESVVNSAAQGGVAIAAVGGDMTVGSVSSDLVTLDADGSVYGHNGSRDISNITAGSLDITAGGDIGKDFFDPLTGNYADRTLYTDIDGDGLYASAGGEMGMSQLPDENVYPGLTYFYLDAGIFNKKSLTLQDVHADRIAVQAAGDLAVHSLRADTAAALVATGSIDGTGGNLAGPDVRSGTLAIEAGSDIGKNQSLFTDIDALYAYAGGDIGASGSGSPGISDAGNFLAKEVLAGFNNGIPRFLQADYIELDKVERISRFRSGFGHNYADIFENGRSMKHYDWLLPSALDNTQLFSPVDGDIVVMRDEGRGTSIQIKPDNVPGILINIFHVAVDSGWRTGDRVSAGQRLGLLRYQEGITPTSDIAISLGHESMGEEGNRFKLFSYFDAMPDTVFASYADRGVPSRDDLIISKADRDNDPLTYGPEGYFTHQGNIPNWVALGSVPAALEPSNPSALGTVILRAEGSLTVDSILAETVHLTSGSGSILSGHGLKGTRSQFHKSS